MRETLAAGILLSCGWRGDRPFLDPMCGSGTIAIEAALVAARRAPGLGRSFAFEGFPGHDAARTERLRARLAALARPVSVPVHASDRNGGALRLAQKNAAAAGVADAIRFVREDAAAAEPPAGAGLCAVNPPYGVRLDEDAAGAWRSLAALLPRLRGWDVAILGPRPWLRAPANRPTDLGAAGPERRHRLPPPAAVALTAAQRAAPPEPRAVRAGTSRAF